MLSSISIVRWMGSSVPTKLMLNRPGHADLRALKKFVGQRQMNWKHVERDLRLIQHQYALYQQDFERCSTYPALAPRSSRGPFLSALYDQRPKCLSYIEEQRKRANAKLSVCPYCGLPGRLTLDHYLPRAKGAFPHFSVYAFNLVPACDACQAAKGAFAPANRRTLIRPKRRPEKRRREALFVKLKKGSKKSKRDAAHARHGSPVRILHPYFDDFLADVIWQLEWRNNQGPVSSLELVPAVINPRRSSLVRFHIEKLKVADRCRKDVGHWLAFAESFLRQSAIQMIEPARDAVGKLLRSTREKDKTPNSIACVVFRAIGTDTVLLTTVLQRASLAVPVLTVRSQGVLL
jgi:5-methylcytosine-specific restriction endonuclease McrA